MANSAAQEPGESHGLCAESCSNVQEEVVTTLIVDNLVTRCLPPCDKLVYQVVDNLVTYL